MENQPTIDIPKHSMFIHKGFEYTLDDVTAKLETDIEQGLDQEDITRRVEIFGANEIITPKQSIWQIYLAPLFDTLIVIYLIMTGIMVILSFFVDKLLEKIMFWIVLISFNMILAIFQQFRAQKKIEALQKLSPPLARVIREGARDEIDAKYLVPGDIIELALGDRIPADARLVSSSNLTVNEASLTGESEPAEKVREGSKALDPMTTIAAHKNMVYLGTFVQTGFAKAIIIRTGNYTELGKIASAMAEIDIEIPLRKRVNTLGKWLGFVMVFFLFILISFTSYRRWDSGEKFSFDVFAFDLSQAIINAMAVLPINIPLLTTVILITGVLNMAKKRVVIKELSVVETLGRCSVLCSDKTGTMTTSKMTVKLVYDTDDFYSVTLKENLRNAMCRVDEDEVKDILEKQVEREEEIVNIVPDTSLDLLLTTAILNNEAVIVPVTDKKKGEQQVFEIIGNPTDGALLVLAMTNGLHVDTIRKRYLKERIYPFDSMVKRMSGLFKDTLENDYMVLAKGATEVILPRCTKIGNENNLRNFTKKEKKEIQAKVDSFANDGYRVISLAYKPIEDIPKTEDEDEEREFMESALHYIGFAIIYDPPRPGVLKAVSELDNAGIFPIMITGDAPTTAATIARQVGILDPHEMVVEGKEASTLTEEDFFKVSVFARVSPQDKEVIVARYQKRGDVVAMTGDGVNDALAITKSDAGVAMGITGTEVAKEAADIIISDDSYVSLVKGVEEGRNLYEKIRMLIFFYIAVNIAEAIVYFTSSLRLDFQILNNWQRVYIFSIIHALPVLAIIFGPQDRNIMLLKPRDNDALLTKRLSAGLAMFAISFALTLLIVFQLYYQNTIGVTEWNKSIDVTFIGNDNDDPNDQLNAEHWSHAKARTMILSIIYLTEAMLVFSIRRINSGIIRFDRRDSSFTVWALILAAPVMHFVLMYITAYQNLFLKAGFQLELLRLNLLDLAVVGIAATIPILVLELFKLYHRRKGIQL